MSLTWIDYLSEDQALWRTESLSERHQDLIRLLSTRVLWLANEHLTIKQLEILHLIMKGYSQQEVADCLQKSQSTINKMIIGVRVYAGKYKGKCYGGYLRKLKLVCTADPVCQRFLKQIAEEVASQRDDS